MSDDRIEETPNPDNCAGSLEEPYHRLAEHLDRLPGGFSPSKTGAHIRLLKKLFTPEEAELATHLTLKQEDAKTIAKKARLSAPKTEKLLDEMAMKGLIFSVQPPKGPALYQAAPWVIGIYEFQVNNLNEGLLEALNDYWDTNEPRDGSWKLNQLRTIPIGQSIEPTLEMLPYEQVEELVEANDTFAVAPCICRTKERKQGRGCDAPIETCLVFGEFADFYVKTGRGRYISKTEMMEKIAEANEANLVLNPTNSRFVSAICCCCGCCCGILKGLQQYPKPSEIVVSSFVAEHDPEACVGCGVCLDRCQMQALTEKEDKVSLNSDRCIGCGLCVSTCPTGALSLVRKPESAQKEIPATLYDTWYKITEEMSQKK
ncbi:MAG TPA: 4Fe-4S binding protein [Candidatus Krumholzibacteriaceae bacterium]|nr:4Fe-4S binding protein [Candidatus Krumholzibacteriaceae bacterium]